MNYKGKVLLVEDNKKLNTGNARALTMMGYEAYQALTLAEAREHLAKIEPDIILLDIMLPDGDGAQFAGEIRRATQAHILFLTDKTDRADIVDGLAKGGDDYITKPFNPDELFARIEAVMWRRNMTAAPTQIIKKGALALDVVALRAFIDGSDLLLQTREFAMLLMLVQNEGTVIDGESLYEKAWGQPMAADRNALQVAVSNVWKKIEPSGYGIKTVRGKGYVFEKSAAEKREP